MGLFEVLVVWRVCCLVTGSTRLEARGLGGLGERNKERGRDSYTSDSNMEAEESRHSTLG